MPTPSRKRPTRVPDRAAAEEAAWWQEEKARSDRLGRLVQETGGPIDADAPDAGGPTHEDAVAHLKSLPPHLAIQKASEWTGRTDIRTLDEAVAAVRDALSEGSSGADSPR